MNFGQENPTCGVLLPQLMSLMTAQAQNAGDAAKIGPIMQQIAAIQTQMAALKCPGVNEPSLPSTSTDSISMFKKHKLYIIAGLAVVLIGSYLLFFRKSAAALRRRK